MTNNNGNIEERIQRLDFLEGKPYLTAKEMKFYLSHLRFSATNFQNLVRIRDQIDFIWQMPLEARLLLIAPNQPTSTTVVGEFIETQTVGVATIDQEFDDLLTVEEIGEDHKVLGYFHFHPGGMARPSPKDKHFQKETFDQLADGNEVLVYKDITTFQNPEVVDQSDTRLELKVSEIPIVIHYEGSKPTRFVIGTGRREIIGAKRVNQKEYDDGDEHKVVIQDDYIGLELSYDEGKLGSVSFLNHSEIVTFFYSVIMSQNNSLHTQLLTSVDCDRCRFSDVMMRNNVSTLLTDQNYSRRRNITETRLELLSRVKPGVMLENGLSGYSGVLKYPVEIDWTQGYMRHFGEMLDHYRRLGEMGEFLPPEQIQRMRLLYDMRLQQFVEKNRPPKEQIEKFLGGTVESLFI
jgi:hypothetical protein